jgi:hypothetical protein
MKLVCEECGSDNIQTLMWVGVNTNEVGDSGPGETNDNWCNECESHVDFIDEEEFLNLKQLEL